MNCLKLYLTGSILFLMFGSSAFGEAIYKLKVQFQNEVYATTGKIVYVEFGDRKGFNSLGICEEKRESADLIQTLHAGRSKTVELKVRSKDGTINKGSSNIMDVASNLCVVDAEIVVTEIR